MKDRAVSPLLGFILVFAIIVTAIGIIQNFFLPSWIKDDEWNQYVKLKSKFESLDEKILEASSLGMAIVKLDLRMEYPNYPFLLTPSYGTSLIEIKKIGRLKITGDVSSSMIDIYAIIFVPDYYYLDVNKEYFVLGEYYSENGVLISDENIYYMQNGKEYINIMAINASQGTHSEVFTLRLKSSKDNVLKLEKVNVSINLSVTDPDWSWLVKSLADRVRGYGKTPTTDNTTYINFSASNAELFFTGVGVNGVISVPIPVVSTRTLNLTAQNETIPVSDGGTITVNFNVTATYNVYSTVLYLTGTIGYSNHPVNVSISYHFTDNSNNEYWWNTSFVWYSLSDGYFQLPIAVPEIRDIVTFLGLDFIITVAPSDYAIVKLKYGKEEFNFTINFTYT